MNRRVSYAPARGRSHAGCAMTSTCRSGAGGACLASLGAGFDGEGYRVFGLFDMQKQVSQGTRDGESRKASVPVEKTRTRAAPASGLAQQTPTIERSCEEGLSSEILERRRIAQGPIALIPRDEAIPRPALFAGVEPRASGCPSGELRREIGPVGANLRLHPASSVAANLPWSYPCQSSYCFPRLAAGSPVVPERWAEV